jgi:hypothetical protein
MKVCGVRRVDTIMHHLLIYSNMQTIMNPSMEPQQRLNVDLPQSQYFALKSYALHTNQTVSQLVRSALQQVVDYDTWFRERVQQAQALARDPKQAVYDEAAWTQVRATKQAQQAKQRKSVAAKAAQPLRKPRTKKAAA